MKRSGERSVRSAAVILSAALLLGATGLGGCGKIQEENGREANASSSLPETGNPDSANREDRVPGSGYMSSSQDFQEEMTGFGGEGTRVLSDNGGEAYFDNTTTIVLDGKTYDITERVREVNAITNIRAVEGYWIVTGHISPDTSYYGFYNTETGQWDTELLGAGLTWYGADEGEEEIPFSMDTVVYTVAGELYDNNGELVGKVELDEKEHEYIYGLERSSEGIQIRILNDAVEEREIVLEMPLPGRS